MSDFIDRAGWPSRLGPWSEVQNLSRLFDQGWAWCVNAAGHPDPEGGYPDVARHLPWDECRSREVFLHGARAGLEGALVEVAVYAAAAFRFGQLREAAGLVPGARIVLDVAPTLKPDGEASGLAVDWRISVSLGEALRLARVLCRAVDVVTYPEHSPA